MILDLRPADIRAPGTPGVSQGTKILVSKIFSYHPQMMFFMSFVDLFDRKLQKSGKTRLFYQFSY